MSQVLYRKWRPRRWDEVVGQPHIIQTLRNAVAANRVAHAYLFCGPRGTGKTTAARLLAKAVNCLEEDLEKRPCDQCEHCQAVNEGRFLDLIEIDAASNTSVDDVRGLREKINFSPNQGRYKVYIIDEVHMLSTAAFNALLKTLEEPPPHAIFILATTEVQKIPATVLSRCQRHEFRRIAVNEIIAYLKPKAAEEGLQIDAEALKLIARQSTGCLRDAISLLDQLASTGEAITLDFTQSILGTAPDQEVFELIEALQDGRAAQGLECIQRTLDRGSDPRQFARQVVDYLRDLLLVCMGSVDQVDATPEVRSQMARHAQRFSVTTLLEVVKNFNQAAVESRSSWQPALPLEMAFVDSLEALTGATVPRAAVEAEKAPTPLPKSQKASPHGLETMSSAAAEKLPTAEMSNEEKDIFKRIEESWRVLLTAVRQKNPQTQALLNSCRLLGIKDGRLILGFNNNLVKSKMESSDHLAIARQTLTEIIGIEIAIECVVASGQRGILPADVERDGMIAAAVDLGGRVINR